MRNNINQISEKINKVERLLKVIHEEHVELARLYGTEEYLKEIDKRWKKALNS